MSPVGSHIEAIDVATQPQAVDDDLYQLLARFRLEPGRILEREVVVDKLVCGLKPGRLGAAVDIVDEQGRRLRLLVEQLLPRRSDHRLRRTERAFGAGQIVELLQNGVHESATGGGR